MLNYVPHWRCHLGSDADIWIQFLKGTTQGPLSLSLVPIGMADTVDPAREDTLNFSIGYTMLNYVPRWWPSWNYATDM